MYLQICKYIPTMIFLYILIPSGLFGDHEQVEWAVSFHKPTDG